jgi:hypothetical protein
MPGDAQYSREAHGARQGADRLPPDLPQIALRHGQVMWLLEELGYSGAVRKSTFHEYIKSLRKLGIPFGRKRFSTKHRRKLATYSFYEIMELALTLSLRVYHVVPDSVLRKIIQHRPRLRQLYRRAYVQRYGGAGKPVAIRIEGHSTIDVRGLFLHLDINFFGGRLVRFGPPQLLPFTEALGLFSERSLFGRTFLQMNLSLLSERVVALALRAPTIRSGPKRRIKARRTRKMFSTED